MQTDPSDSRILVETDLVTFMSRETLSVIADCDEDGKFETCEFDNDRFCLLV